MQDITERHTTIHDMLGYLYLYMYIFILTTPTSIQVLLLLKLNTQNDLKQCYV